MSLCKPLGGLYYNHVSSHLQDQKMRFPSLFLTSILASISLVAGDALQKWTEIASKSRSNVIRLDETTFDQLITTERNYTSISTSYQMWKLIVLVALTALQPQYQCALCREFDPEFATVAESWRRAHPQSDGVFFGKVDFPEGRPIFVRVLYPIAKDVDWCSLDFSLHRMYGCILQRLVLFPN
jgi:OST3 / OST6 family, transporter family